MTKVLRLSKKAEDAVLLQAFDILDKRMNKARCLLSEPSTVKDYLKLKLSRLEYEVFGVLFLDVKNKLIANRVMFNGTLTHTSVYPREVVKLALHLNACSVVIYHNHPSGDVKPSPGDLILTKSLTASLAMVDVKLVDHIVVAALSTFSFAEGGLL